MTKDRERSMRRGLVTAIVMLLVCCIAFAPTASALRVPSLPTQQLVNESAAIVVATVLAVDPSAGSRRGECGTSVTLRVDEVLGGTATAGTTLSFEQPVGYLPDGTRWQLAGLPAFEAGQTYLLFLTRGEWRTTPVTNVTQGLLRRVQVGGRTHYVSDTGLVLRDLTDKGFEFGERVARPMSDNLPSATPDDEQDGTALVLPARAAERARSALSSNDVHKALRKWIDRSPINVQSAEVRLQSSMPKRGRS